MKPIHIILVAALALPSCGYPPPAAAPAKATAPPAPPPATAEDQDARRSALDKMAAGGLVKEESVRGGILHVLVDKPTFNAMPLKSKEALATVYCLWHYKLAKVSRDLSGKAVYFRDVTTDKELGRYSPASGLRLH